MFQYTIFIFATTIVVSYSSCPSEITQTDIEKFKKGHEELLQAAAQFKPKEENFDRNNYSKPTKAEEYDFIIIGGGTAGSVMATRLSEIPEWKILVLEAGGDETVYTKTPGYCEILPGTKYSWWFSTTPQKKSCQGMVDKKCGIAAGKILGGSSSINGLTYTRGNRRDYDLWADLGNPGWSYDEVLPYFKKLEDFVDIQSFDRGYHNYGGPVHPEFSRYVYPLTNETLRAASEITLETIDYNGKRQIGVSRAQSITKRGVRQSTNEAYLKPAKNRPNLTIKTFSQVIKIVITPRTKQATGVEYIKDGKLFVANARKEVIVSAGAISTPKLLMLSGIGPKEDLKKFKIPLVKDLRVGRYYQDQMGYSMLLFLYNDTETSVDPKYDPVEDYLKNHQGPLTSSGYPVIGFYNSHISNYLNSDLQPNLEFNTKLIKISSSSAINPTRFKQVLYDKFYKPHEGQRALIITNIILHPKSHGTLKLKDSDPLHYPLIDSNGLSDPKDDDINTMLSGVKTIIKLSKTESFSRFKLRLIDTPVPGCEAFGYGTDDYWRCAIRQFATYYLHIIGTAKMGPGYDREAVVDNKLRVYGVKNLRVADNSVVPVSISGHTMICAIMIGEKASVIIKDAWPTS